MFSKLRLARRSAASKHLWNVVGDARPKKYRPLETVLPTTPRCPFLPQRLRHVPLGSSLIIVTHLPEYVEGREVGGRECWGGRRVVSGRGTSRRFRAVAMTSAIRGLSGRNHGCPSRRAEPLGAAGEKARARARCSSLGPMMGCGQTHSDGGNSTGSPGM
jgi:hypothetical protein